MVANSNIGFTYTRSGLLCLIETSFAAMNRCASESRNNGDKRAKLALRISDNFEKTITTLLIGNNITHIAFASLVTLISTELWA